MEKERDPRQRSKFMFLLFKVATRKLGKKFLIEEGNVVVKREMST
jgi:hypothetical protein